MKIRAKDGFAQRKLGDWKTWYIADQLGIENNDASDLVAGKVIEVSKSRVAQCAPAIQVLLSVVKSKTTKGVKK